jgi:hypothetical protein
LLFLRKPESEARKISKEISLLKLLQQNATEIVAQVAKSLSSNHETLSSNTSIEKENKYKKDVGEVEAPPFQNNFTETLMKLQGR